MLMTVFLPRFARRSKVRAKYAGYIERQQDEIDRQQRNEDTRLPEDLDYLQVTGLSNEVRQKADRGASRDRRTGEPDARRDSSRDLHPARTPEEA